VLFWTDFPFGTKMMLIKKDCPVTILGSYFLIPSVNKQHPKNNENKKINPKKKKK